MNSRTEVSAAAASDSYVNRSQDQVDYKTVHLGDWKYQVFGYKVDSVTGFHATAYREVAPPHSIIIAYRGTDPAITDITGHTLTTIQDIAVDAAMVRDHINPQESAASAFTQEMIDKAKRNGISKDQITVAGHSLGGTLAEIEASKYGLGGATFNAYGAASLGYGVPEGGGKVTDYVMAGDVVSAASRHHGRVVTLASPEDLSNMQAGRYLDAPMGAQPPNPFLAMSLGDHSIQHFVGSGSVLKPEILTQYEKNYLDNKAAIDAYRNDVYREREELSKALRQAQSSDRRAQLPPDIQAQLDEYLTVNVDPVVGKQVTQNSAVLGAEHGLQTGADTLRTGGQYVQSQYERVAAAAHAANRIMGPANPAAALAGAVVGEAAHLDGQAASALGGFAADSLHAARRTIERGAHDAAQTLNAAIHGPGVQAAAIHLVNGTVDAYRTVESIGHATAQAIDRAGQAVSHGIDATMHSATQAYDDTRQAASHSAVAIGHAARRAGEKLHDLAEQAGTAYAESMTLRGQAMSAATDALLHRPPADTHKKAIAPDQDDPRHPDSPLHGLYNELHRRVPDAGERRLLQFTAACHAHSIGAHNLGTIRLDEANAIMHFCGNDIWAQPVSVNFSQPSPPPEQSIQRIQQRDLQQAQVTEQIPAMSQAQVQQGPVPGSLAF
ncbi:hypothetical protein [Rhodanobacter aciditrophus]|uniref:hypothetical protein n=1 Tax=Rhodanobacter aciditrophus TaxID=1623218 RepID=UPI003CF41F88